MTKEEFEAAASAGQDVQLHAAAPRRRTASWSRCRTTQAYKAELERAAALLRDAAALSADKAFANYLQHARRRAAQRRLPPQRHGVDGHEDQPGRRRDRPDRDLRRPAVRLQGRVRRPGAGQGRRMEREARPLRQASCRNCRRACRWRRSTRPRSRAPRPTSTPIEVVYYGGNANVGAKTIAINLPNDEEVQLAKGTRRLQLENVMKAKFDAILMPIAQQLIAQGPAQARHLRRVLRGRHVP